jgi:hypothetical protein
VKQLNPAAAVAVAIVLSPQGRQKEQDITKLYSLGNVLHQVRSNVLRGVRRRRQRYAVIRRNVAPSRQLLVAIAMKSGFSLLDLRGAIESLVSRRLPRMPFSRRVSAGRWLRHGRCTRYASCRMTRAYSFGTRGSI